MQGEFGAISDQTFSGRVRGLGEQQRVSLSYEFWSQQSQDPSSLIYSYSGPAQRATTRLTWELEEGIVELELAGRSRRSFGGPFEEDCWSWESRD